MATDTPPRPSGAEAPETATILVVDDEPDLVELIQYALEAEGLTVLTAGDGVEGLALVEAERPDLVVVDIMMPRMDTVSS